MTVSAFDLFTVGIGPSSSHTVGPMRAARLFVERLGREGLLPRVVRVRAELFGSLGATGKGHGSVGAVVRGLAGEEPETVDPRSSTVADVERTGRIRLAGVHEAAAPEVILHRRRVLPFHPNGMRFTATAGDTTLLTAEYFSVGGGFVVDGEAWRPPAVAVPHPYSTGAELLTRCRETGLSISALTLANECASRTEAEVRDGLLALWAVMQECVERGSTTTGVLPGGLQVRRRAADMRAALQEEDADPAEWVTLFALAVNEENAAGGRVVTAPTNGAAGIVPAVLHYYRRFCRGADDDGVVRFLLAATAVGSLFKENASISGAEVGCQGEVGSACSMAAAGLAEVMGGSPEQVENAAEIGIEHNLGLTCDPIGGLVQIPCIERNAVAASKAITAARMAVRGDGVHHVSLDKAIRTMRLTGRDMKSKYKETSRGGLALTVVEC
ncbi:L-serine ammonia-lyase [Pseudonocardia sp. WMMC193]|uniref:L-serine ammonia-lyase n=1 Tax=Pseudonocardia sp. WMMC193 TaxID=2911965 RepID=UPI001F0188C5|nr:L-serine ammonia-lyase [Pseudonocardia sp. WMMC193]MCF7549898.1 L-serine ammonia-lyase [Pseudonocardia sp. WMMC193]